MSRLKLIGAALLLVVFDTYTASAEQRTAVAGEGVIEIAPTLTVESEAVKEVVIEAPGLATK